MTTRYLVNAEFLPTLDMFPELHYTKEALPQIRASSNEMNAQALSALPETPDIATSEHRIPGPQGAPDVRVLIYRPKNVSTPTPALLWMHWGAYLIGNAGWAEPQLKHIVAVTGCTAVAVDYRLAPETSHPGQIEDCYAALKWVYTNASELGVDASRIAIGGDSAGGGLAAGLALLARDRGEVPIIFQLMIYPMLDDRTVTTVTPNPYVGEYVWTANSNRFAWTAVLGQEPGSPNITPYIAPSRAEHLEGLPPAFLAVGSLDLFVDEGIEYAHRLLRAGVPTELHVYPGVPHGFALVAPRCQGVRVISPRLCTCTHASFRYKLRYSGRP